MNRSWKTNYTIVINKYIWIKKIQIITDRFCDQVSVMKKISAQYSIKL